MSHVQQQIIDAAESVLKASPGLAGVNVYNEPLEDIRPEQMPALRIDGGDEVDEVASLGLQCMQERHFQFTVTAFSKGEDCNPAVRNLQSQIETALFAVGNPLLVKMNLLELQGAVAHEVEPQISVAVAAKRLHFKATYFTQSGQPETSL